MFAVLLLMQNLYSFQARDCSLLLSRLGTGTIQDASVCHSRKSAGKKKPSLVPIALPCDSPFRQTCLLILEEKQVVRQTCFSLTYDINKCIHCNHRRKGSMGGTMQANIVYSYWFPSFKFQGAKRCSKFWQRYHTVVLLYLWRQYHIGSFITPLLIISSHHIKPNKVLHSHPP